MSTDPQGGLNTFDSSGRPGVSRTRLWFGFITSFLAWTCAGLLDLLVIWACPHQEDFGIPPAHPIARIVLGLLAVVFLIITVYSGIVSYRNWQRLSARQTFLCAQAVDRREFMAVLGVIMTVTLGASIVWLALLPLFLDLSWRAR